MNDLSQCRRWVFRMGCAAAVISAFSAGSPARADIVGIDGQATSAAVGLLLGACNFNQGLGTHPLIGIHGDFRFSRWLGAGLFVNYVSLGSSVPGMSGVTALDNGSFYVAALELNLFTPGFLSGFSLGPSFGFSTYNSPPTVIQGSYNSTYLVYGLRAGYDLPVFAGASAGVFVSDLVINSNSDLGYNTNELNLGAALKFWF